MISSSFPALKIRGRSLLPIVQGGMGVGISGHRLAGAVARHGAIGTLASVDLRRLYPDIMQRLRRCRDPAVHSAANVEALDREIRAAREIAGPDGFIAVNVMRALSNYAELVVQACKSGADAIVSGAGLPFDLPDLVEPYPNVALIPILSEERGVRAVLKRWARKGRTPDAIVIEHPRYAGGHLGATRIEDVADPKYDFEHVFAAIREVCAELGEAARAVPLIAAGGINSPERIAEALRLGASAVQIGTPFAVTLECDAHPNFKRVLAEAVKRIKPGMTEREVAGIFMSVSFEQNPQEPVSAPLVQTGLSAADPHAFAGGRAVQPGDLMVIDFGAVVEDYGSDITRTIAIGEPSAEMKHIYEVVKAANAAGRAAVRPGILAEDIDKAARAVIDQAGYGQYFTHRTGHGLGLEGHESPYMVQGDKTVLEVGMTFTVEPGIYIEGKGGVRIEDDMVVTADGGESLTTFSRDLIIA